MGSEVTVLLSPSKAFSLHSFGTVAEGVNAVPGVEPEFWECRTRQDRVQAIRCCSDLATRCSGSHLEVTGVMCWSTASIPGAPNKRRNKFQ